MIELELVQLNKPKMMRIDFYVLMLFGFWQTACGQAKVPKNLPAIEQEAFDQRLQQLLKFTVPLVGIEELSEASPSQYLLLDARELVEYQTSHIPGAKFLGYKNPDWDLLQGVDKQQPILLYCSVGYRSEKLGEKLKAQGFENVHNLYGSIFEWVNQGNLLEDQNGSSTQKIHTYNKKWSKWVKDNSKFEKVW